MNREKAEKLLAALIFDDLDEPSKANLLDYLQSDDELRERLADMRMAAKVTSDALQHGPDPVLNKKRLKQLAKLAGRSSRQRVFFTRPRLAAAAAIIAAVLLPALLILPSITPLGERAEYVAMSPEAEPGYDIEFSGRTSVSSSKPSNEHGGGLYYSLSTPVISNSALPDSTPKNILGDSVASRVVVDSADSTSRFRSHYYKAPETGGMGLSAANGGQLYASDAWRKGRSADDFGAYVPAYKTSPVTWGTVQSGLEKNGARYAPPTGGPEQVVAGWHYSNGSWEVDGDDDSIPTDVVASTTWSDQPDATARQDLRSKFRGTYGFPFVHSSTGEPELGNEPWAFTDQSS
ncbi:MAG: anti-sigma factor family protein, partial [Planctomycetota bacterium]